jgi:1,4-dihydroxy-2-naphthoate octaprenyltransferase
MNSVKAWFLASRPKTLAGAAAPVVIGGSIAWHDISEEIITGRTFEFLPFILCVAFAMFMQIDANLINDYFDFVKGTDRSDRLGPERACAQGWISPKAMKIGIGVATALSCLIGLPLILWGGYSLIAVGLLCVIFCFLYTTRLSYLGYGDLLVLVFFGIVPVCCTYFILTGTVSLPSLLSGTGCGLATDCLLMVNNYRDRHEDKKSGKRTIVVRLGAHTALHLYKWLGIAASLLAVTSIALSGNTVYSLLILPYVAMHSVCYIQMTRKDGRELNTTLGKTSLTILTYALCLALAFILP